MTNVESADGRLAGQRKRTGERRHVAIQQQRGRTAALTVAAQDLSCTAAHLSSPRGDGRSFCLRPPAPPSSLAPPSSIRSLARHVLRALPRLCPLLRPSPALRAHATLEETSADGSSFSPLPHSHLARSPISGNHGSFASRIRSPCKASLISCLCSPGMRLGHHLYLFVAIELAFAREV